MFRHLSLVVLVLVVASCSRPAPAPAAREWGSVMVDVGHRFELAGRAAAANRWELAAFEADEMGELFENDLAHAELPKEGPTAQLPAMADAFRKNDLPELTKAAKSKDSRAFADAFARAAATCNGCHLTSGHPFIEIPSVPGKAVPDLDPAP